MQPAPLARRVERPHDLILARQWVTVEPIVNVIAWASEAGFERVHTDSYVATAVYGYELVIFRRTQTIRSRERRHSDNGLPGQDVSLFMKLPSQTAPVKLFCECRLNCHGEAGTVALLEFDQNIRPLKGECFGCTAQHGQFVSLDINFYESNSLKFQAVQGGNFHCDLVDVGLTLQSIANLGTVSSVRHFLQELAYEGHFLLHGQLSSITDFQKALHQNPQQLQEGRRAEYVCNFIFIPNERAKFLAKRLHQATS